MIWHFIQKKLQSGIRVILMIVVESKGSSPGRSGFKLVLGEDGDSEGSVGGGIMEFRLMQEAPEWFDRPEEIFLKKLVHEEKADSGGSGMICAGSQQVVFVPLTPDQLPLIEQIVEAGSGRLSLSPAGLAFRQADPEDLEAGTTFRAGDDWSYQEALGLDPQLIVFGGGHIGLALSRLFRELDFRITVLDDREEKPKTLRENHFADEIRQIDYGQAYRYVPEGPHIYVVIATHTHESDGLILDQLLDKRIRYLGMLGSKKKVSTIKRVLKKAGWQEEDLSRVDAPVGMQIGSQTPAEIAVSIAARVIQVKNQ